MESAEHFALRTALLSNLKDRTAAVEKRDRAVAAEAMERAAKIADTHATYAVDEAGKAYGRLLNLAAAIRAAGDGKPQP